MALSLSPQEIVRRDEYPLLRIAPSWERVRLGDIANVQNGFPFKSNLFSTESGFPLIRIRDVGRGETLHFYAGEYDNEFVVKRGDILIGMDGDFRAARWKGPDALLNQRVCRLTVESEHYDEDFFLTCLQPYLNAVNAETSSVTVKHLSSKTVQDIPLPLPPLNEQRRIVEKIEAIFDEIDKGGESLQTARTTLGLYRQSLLKSAYQGRLTADWRAKNADKLEDPETLLARVQKERDTRYKAALDAWQDALAKWRADDEKGKKPAKPKRPPEVTFATLEQTKDLSELPIGWSYFTVGSLCEVVRGGSPRPAGDKRYYDGDIPFLKVADLTRPKGQFVRQFTYTIKEAGLSKTRLVEPETLMISNSGATLGVPKICKIEATFNDGIAAFLGLAPDENAFHYWFWVRMTPVLRLINQGAAQPNLNTTLLAETVIPQCSPAEQAEIVRRLDAQLEAADALEAEIDAALTRADALRQSILKKAFSGHFVPQDPNDEPASALLERIKTDRVKAPKKTRKKAPA